MKIFLLVRTDNYGYDTYDSCVVVAKDVQDAKTIHPNKSYPGPVPFHDPQETWVTDLKDICATYVGEAGAGVARGVICASFNEG